jgi:beta-galactosidase
MEKPRRPTFVARPDGFYLDGKKSFLNSGEIHYFRVKRELWDKHLDAAREAGLNAVSTYIPWAWHEREETVFDFDGSSCPERDLLGWLQCCRAHGLHCIVKPGPFILAEFRGAGLPDWFLDRYGDEVRMRTSKGAVVQGDGVSLSHPVYLDRVTRWYDKIMPLIREHEISAGGPIIMMQVCNEVGIFSWLARQADYGASVRAPFVAYLSDRFSDISELNTLWGTDYRDFAQVDLPPDGRLPYASRWDRGRDHEWHCFWRTYYGHYLRALTRLARDRGVTVPFYHNLPGWIYGRGREFPVNITMYADLFGDGSELRFGVDHIPEFMSYRNMHDDRIINDVTTAMQRGTAPFAAEFQCGSREYHVVTNPRELELFYKASLANGLVGWNYYMFSQGRNPRRRGFSGDTFYWFTPLTAEGERTSSFPLLQRMSALLETSGSVIVDSQRKAEICVLFYPPYYGTELERPVDAACGLHFLPSAIRASAYFDGLLKALQVLNIDYDMVDLGSASAAALRDYKQVWAFTTDEMNADAQRTIVDFARAGGNAVLFPCLPDREMSGRACTIIRDALEIAPCGSEVVDSPLIDILGLTDIKCANPQLIYAEDLLADAEVIARTLRGTACGFCKSLGRGTVSHIGTWLGFDTEGHRPVYEALLGRSGARLRNASASNESLTVRQRFGAGGAGTLFVGNYYNEEHTGRVTYTHPATGETVGIPFSGDEMPWPALYAVLTPICLEVCPGVTVLHSTSDILSIAASEGGLAFTLYGDRDLPGELVLEGAGVARIAGATVAARATKMRRRDNRVALSYSHQHKQAFALTVVLGG